MAQKRRGGRAPVGRGPIGKKPPSRPKDLGPVSITPTVHQWMAKHGVSNVFAGQLVYQHIDGLKSIQQPNTKGVVTLHHTPPGLPPLPQLDLLAGAPTFAVMKVTSGHLILFSDELRDSLI